MERYPYGKDIVNALHAQGEEDTVEVKALRPNEVYSKDVVARAAGKDAAPSALDAAANQKMSVLGKSLVFKGELKANEDLLIQGRVEGSITHSASHLAIGAHGDVTADVHAQRVIVQGKLEGDVHATESVVIEVSANVQGNIYAPRVAIKDGAKFRGSIDMDPGAAAAPAKGAGSNRRAKPKPEPEPDADDVDEILS
jgi:cytoskeletal protein CcmA (bactofilin family)